MAKPDSGTKKGLLKLLKKTFSDLAECEDVEIDSSFRLPEKKIRVHLRDYPIQINLSPDGDALHLYPERTLTSDNAASTAKSYLLFDPNNYYNQISGFIRLRDGDDITIGGDDYPKNDFLPLNDNITRPRLKISNDAGNLIFKAYTSDTGTCIAPLLKDKKVHLIINWRMQKLQRLRRIFGGPIAPLPAGPALSLLQQVNSIVQNEPYRARDSSGQAGGLVAIPDHKAVFILADLHAKPDNLLVALSQNGFLEALEEDRACLLIIGDAVHPEGDVPLDEMDDSILMMDLIFKLKVRFPQQLFYLRGNHDSFSEEIAKGGVPQGLLWSKALIKTRGENYKQEMEAFYRQLPYVAFSKHVIACHAAPPTSAATPDMLVNIKDNPKLINELINTRMRAPNRPAGYTKGDIKKFRKCLGVSKSTPVIVGHTPLSVDDTLWENVGDIENHHILYSSDSRWVGVMAQIGGHIYPFRYPVESLIPIINSLDD